MAVNKSTAQQRLDAANQAAKVETQLRRAVQEKDVNLGTQLDADILKLGALLTVIANA